MKQIFRLPTIFTTMFKAVVIFANQNYHIFHCMKIRYLRINYIALLLSFWSKIVKFVKSTAALLLNNDSEVSDTCCFIETTLSTSERQAQEEEEERISLTVLASPKANEEILVDVIFVHGLQGSVGDTWKQGEWTLNKNRKRELIKIVRSQSKQSVSISELLDEQTANENEFTDCWPKDWLPKDFPNARIIGLNYSTDDYLWQPIWSPARQRSNLSMRANKMLALLTNHRVGVNRPIVWIGHSKGGLYIKQMLVNAHTSSITDAHSIWQSTRSVLFYSVPHRGSPLAKLCLPFLRQSIELIEIHHNFPTTLDLNRHFISLCSKGVFKMDVCSFVETKLTQLSVFNLRIIDITSGDPGIGDVYALPLDHVDVCKPRHRNCILYRQLFRMIEKAISEYKNQLHETQY